MPSVERSRHERMKLRHNQSMTTKFNELHPKIFEILSSKCASLGSTCTPGELRAAARYLTSTLAEYVLRRKNSVRDKTYVPHDEALWREDLALKGLQASDPIAQKIAYARHLRAKYQKPNDPSYGSARHGLVNAIRHAWLVCHEGLEHVSYGRLTLWTDHPGEASKFGGDLHNFIGSFVSICGVSIGIDHLHKQIRALDLERCPDLTTANSL
ncbi:hypothetical protein [Pseudomonas fragi]|uniref:hypothetical protein n=1 Tax=Pseudomonas fragi TaxID=296 RepID=UPI0011401797|nr:hypothetical protein [Pseudomonas fragi]